MLQNISNSSDPAAASSPTDPFDLICHRRKESYANAQLDMWTVYDRPKDFPHGYVARRFVFDKPTDDLISGSLESLRTAFMRAGFNCLTRAESDEPQIVETWL